MTIDIDTVAIFLFFKFLFKALNICCEIGNCCLFAIELKFLLFQIDIVLEFEAGYHSFHLFYQDWLDLMELLRGASFAH